MDEFDQTDGLNFQSFGVGLMGSTLCLQSMVVQGPSVPAQMYEKDGSADCNSDPGRFGMTLSYLW